MSNARRSKFISAAQVAYYYNYTLAEALALSTNERHLLLAVAYDVDEKQFVRLGRMLGVHWTVEDLTAENRGRSHAPSDTLNLPLLPFVAPELFQATIKEYKEKAAKRKTTGENITEIGTLSVAEAKALLKSINRT